MFNGITMVSMLSLKILLLLFCLVSGIKNRQAPNYPELVLHTSYGTAHLEPAAPDEFPPP